jgi:hypothetical protein
MASVKVPRDIASNQRYVRPKLADMTLGQKKNFAMYILDDLINTGKIDPDIYDNHLITTPISHFPSGSIRTAMTWEAIVKSAELHPAPSKVRSMNSEGGVWKNPTKKPRIEA